jgi:cytochrome c biogenesis protein CcmG, thiol:disulfide interchange protein DsbE
MNSKIFFIPAIFVFALVALFAWSMFSGVDTKTLDSAMTEQTIPDFTLPDLQNADGQITQENLMGKPILVNIWATWCPTCKIEHPFLNELAQQGVNIVGVDYKDDREDALQWLRDFNNPYFLNIFDEEGMLPLDLGVTGAPETFFVNSDGVIKYRHTGAINQTNWDTELKAIYEGMK